MRIFHALRFGGCCGVLQNIGQPLFEFLNSEKRVVSFSAGLSHFMSQFGIIDQDLDLFGESGHVSSGYQETGITVINYFGYTSFSRRNNRQRELHGLEIYQTKGFVVSWENEDVGIAKEFGFV